MRATKPVVHTDFARRTCVKQTQSFGAWVKQLLPMVAEVAPKQAGEIDLHRMEHCRILFYFYEIGCTQAEASKRAEITTTRWSSIS